jgi:hypothetical protein
LTDVLAGNLIGALVGLLASWPLHPPDRPERKQVGTPTEIDTLEWQQTEKIETEVKDVDRIESIQVYATLSRVSFWGIPFTQYHILFHLCRQVPLKKGKSQMDSSVQDNPAAPSPCQYG